MISRQMATVLAALVMGCASVANKGGDALKSGIDDYAAGNYPAATRHLQSALTSGLPSRDQVKAHKYLAFIGCVTGKTQVCRDEFGKALDIDRTMELDASEAEHPIWGPVFQSVQAKRLARK